MTPGADWGPARGRWVRKMRAWCFGGYAWAVLVALLLPLVTVMVLGGRGGRARRLARIAARLLFRATRVSLAARGIDRLPGRPHVLVVNHSSFIDGIALTALLPATPGYAFAVKQQYCLQSLLWPLLRPLGTLLLRNPVAGAATGNVESMRLALQGGQSLVVFPEGGFVREEGLRHFHSGVFRAAAEAGVPIAVAGLRGARRILPLGSWCPRRHPLVLEIGLVLPCMPLVGAAGHRRLRQMARSAMLDLCGEPDAEAGDVNARDNDPRPPPHAAMHR